MADAVTPDNFGTPETIIVLTDGAPDNRKAVEKVIQAAANGLSAPDDLRILFIQVGTDASAMRWLRSIDSGGGGGGAVRNGGDDELPCKFRIVDTAHTEDLLATGIPFAKWVSRAIFADVLVGSATEAGDKRPSTVGF